MSTSESTAVVHVPRGNAFEFRVTLDAAGVLGRMLDHPHIFAVGIPDPRRAPTRAVPVAETGRSNEFDTNATHDDGPRFNLTRAGPNTYRLAVLYGARAKGSAERVATVHVVPEDGGSLVQCTLRRFSGPADAASALGRGMLTGVLVMGAVFVDPGTVIGGLFWWAWEGAGRAVRRVRGRPVEPTPAATLAPSNREALVGVLGELFTPVKRPAEQAPPTPFRA